MALNTTLRSFSKSYAVLTTQKFTPSQLLRLSSPLRLYRAPHGHRLQEIHTTSLAKNDANPPPSKASTYWLIRDILSYRDDGTKRSTVLGIILGISTALLAQTAFIVIDNLKRAKERYLYHHLLVIRATASNHPSPNSTTNEFIAYIKALEAALMATKNTPDDFPESVARLENYLRAHEAEIDRYDLTQEEWFHDGNLIPEALKYLEGPQFAKTFMSSMGPHVLNELLDNVDWETEMLFAHAIRTVFLSMDVALAKLYEEDQSCETSGSYEQEQSISFQVVA